MQVLLPSHGHDQIVIMVLPFDREGKYVKKNSRREIRPDLLSCIDIKIPYTSSRSSLAKMKGVAKRVKELNQNENIVEIDDIGIFSDDPDFDSNYGRYAYYQKGQIFCNPETLRDPRVRINFANALALNLPWKDWKYRIVTDDLALIILVCHELAHHGTLNHAKEWKIKFSKFFWQIINEIRRLQ